MNSLVPPKKKRSTTLDHIGLVFVFSSLVATLSIVLLSFILRKGFEEKIHNDAAREIKMLFDVEKPRFEAELVNNLFYSAEKRAFALEKEGLGQNGQIAVLNANGALLYATKDFDKTLLRSIHAELAHAEDYQSVISGDHLIYGSNLSYAGKTIGTVILSKAIDTTKTDVLFNVTAAVILTILGISALNLLVVRQTLRRNFIDPLFEMRRAIPEFKKFSSGESENMPKISPFKLKELRLISNAFLSMAADIRKMRQAELEAERKIAVSLMTQMLAHDVRKPFSLLRAGLSILEMTKNQEDLRPRIAKVRKEVERSLQNVNGMIEDILEVGTQNRTLSTEETSVLPLIDLAVKDIQNIYPQSSVEIEYDYRHLHQVKVHAQKISRVFANLISNAFQAINLKGRIQIATIELESFIQIKITNYDSYIPCEQLDRIFDAFFTSGKKNGTGLGLAIAKKVVEQHGGTIGCHSVKDEKFPLGKVEISFTVPKSPVIDDQVVHFLAERKRSASEMSPPTPAPKKLVLIDSGTLYK